MADTNYLEREIQKELMQDVNYRIDRDRIKSRIIDRITKENPCPDGLYYCEETKTCKI